MLLSFHVVLIGLAGARALSVRGKLPPGTAAFWQSSRTATLRGGGGGGGEKNWERLREVFTAMSGRNLSAEILTFFNFLFFFGGGRGGEKGWGGGVAQHHLGKGKQTHKALCWEMGNAQSTASSSYGMGYLG